MKKKKKSLFEGKSKWIIISTIIFAVLGVTALIVGFGLTYGWQSVLNWFGSRWAIYIYILIGIIVFLTAWVLFRKKIEEN